MFTGIIAHCGAIKKIDNVSVAIETQFSDLTLGESVSVDGICLTVTDIQGAIFFADISSETFKVTSAKFFEVGQLVNLERALRLNDRLSGHFVMGHIDQAAKISSIEPEGDFIKMCFSGILEESQPFLVKKGSIAVNGVSLTINQVTDNGFEVMLVPHTLEKTNLNFLKKSSIVNIEFDLVARMIASQIQLRELTHD